MLMPVLQCRFFFFFFLLELIMCLLPSCCLGLSHSTFSIPSPVQFSVAIAVLSLLSAASSTTAKLLWKQLKIFPSDIWVTVFWTPWITYVHHITGLCCLLLILGYRFSQEQMSFSTSCAALISPSVPHGYWEADTVSSAGYFGCQIFGSGLGLAHDKSFPSIFPSSIFDFFFLLLELLTSCPERHFFSSLWEGKTPLLLVLPLLGDLLCCKAMTAVSLCPCPVKPWEASRTAANSVWTLSAVLRQLLSLFTLAEEVLFDPFKTTVQYWIPIPILQLKTNTGSSLSDIHKVTATKLG